ncbi:acyl carrier protein, putative [Plasmodium berghei]|uniref:Acyl carrier protein n=2 Tax=Plasmodium berghei TaxID=5821 RepID=A0A509AF55_PLABA|nr:acyl carrier protein, putative [Plasmodium berghei ANKA]CXH93426.1 acyl carrier protein, putative [Plasmodium berghei]SCN22157.1 acyl carrier protein, putative [Plasmodium berghei]VUC54095.1 acyl carrier protein, putative [Plasmodium berghei ANKA]|eukprot:XP_034419940.1 acyl carrier protein, putative [Plasmodium berghei ANKA]
MLFRKMKIILLSIFFLYYVNAFKNMSNHASLQIASRRNEKTNFRNSDSFMEKKKSRTSLNSTFYEIKSIISKQLSVEEDKIQLTSSFTKDLGADSLDQVELIMALEEHFKITISDQDALKINTVEDAINFIEKNKKPDA